MHLLHTKEYKLYTFGKNDVPLYAILSHRWGGNEITYQDAEYIEKGNTAGYLKVKGACSIARADGFDYIWIDTCCIDKTSSAELSEAINTMYRWYQDASICYVYLDDVSPNKGPADEVIRDAVTLSEFSSSKWFSRGWTLQELLAPSMVVFLDCTWQEVGTKSSLRSTISTVTNIPETILQTSDLRLASVAQKMSWASKRETTRVEDLAYCLMGIFNINMPMLYGEGEKAFIRLQEEILRVSNDHSIFAWAVSTGSKLESWVKDGGLLASSPAAFSESSEIIPHDFDSPSQAITINNKGIHLKILLANTRNSPFDESRLAYLPCAKPGDLKMAIAIHLMPVSRQEPAFVRTKIHKFEVLHIDNSRFTTMRDLHVQGERRNLTLQSPLVRAAEKGDESVLVALMKKGAELNSEAVQAAGRNGHVAAMQLLLDMGANPDDGLVSAARNGHEGVVRLLLDKDARPQEAMIWAAESGHRTIVDLLLAKGADSRAVLVSAAKSGLDTAVRLMLDCGAQPQGGIENAVKHGHESIVRLLLDRGAQPDRKLLSLATEKKYENIRLLLLEKQHEQQK